MAVAVEHRDEVARALGDEAELLLALAQVAGCLARAQDVAHAVAQQRPVDRLGDEVGGPGGERGVDRGEIVEARRHDDGHVTPVAPLPQALAHRDAVDSRHLHIEEQEVGKGSLARGQDRRPVARLHHRETCLFERDASQAARRRLVVGDQDDGLCGLATLLPCHEAISRMRTDRSDDTYLYSSSIAATIPSAPAVAPSRQWRSRRLHISASAAAPRLALADLKLCAARATAPESARAMPSRIAARRLGASPR